MWYKLFPDEINLTPSRASLVQKFKVSELLDEPDTAKKTSEPCRYQSFVMDLLPAVGELAIVAPILVVAAVVSIVWPKVGIVLAPLTAFGLLFTSPVWLMIFALLIAGGMVTLHPEWVFSHLNYTMGALAVIAFMVAVSIFVPRVKALEPLEEETSSKAAPSGDTPGTATAAQVAPVEASEPAKPTFKPVAFDKTIAASGITIVFGTESGNSEGLAELAAQTLQGDGHAVQVLDAEVVDVRHLRAFANFLLITSTWGDGDPPGNAIELTAGIKAATGPDLAGTQFSVCSLGDTNYELFCQCGKDFDTGLEKFGGHRFFDRTDCNVDFEGPFNTWLNGVKGALKGNLKTVAAYDETVDMKALGLLDEAPAAPETAPTPEPAAV